MKGYDSMNFTQLEYLDEINHLSFADQIDLAMSDNRQTFLINDAAQAIGYIQLIKQDEAVYRLKKFSIQQPDQAEEIINIFHHILRFVKEKSAEQLIVKTDQEAVQTLLYLLGFERDLEVDNYFSYTYN